MPFWPRSSCTCKHFLGGQGPVTGIGGVVDERSYFRHRRDKWNQILARRNANDLWLRETARDQNGVVCRASGRTQNTRNTGKRKAHRACRYEQESLLFRGFANRMSDVVLRQTLLYSRQGQVWLRERAAKSG